MTPSTTALPNEAELGQIVGNSAPDFAGLPGITRQGNTVFEYGNIETSSRVERVGEQYVLVDRDRAREFTAAEFSHPDDVERFVVIRDARGRSSGRWFPDRATVPSGVRVEVEDGVYSFSWTDRGAEHSLRAFGVPNASAAYRLCWVRSRPLEQVIDAVTSSSPMHWLREHEARA